VAIDLVRKLKGVQAGRPAVNASSGETWLRENRIEVVACMLPTFEDVLDGMHVVQALGHDGMVVHVGVNTEKAEHESEKAAAMEMLYSRGCFATGDSPSPSRRRGLPLHSAAGRREPGLD